MLIISYDYLIPPKNIYHDYGTLKLFYDFIWTLFCTDKHKHNASSVTVAIIADTIEHVIKKIMPICI